MKNNKEIPEQVRNDKGKKILAFDTCLDKMYAVLKEDDKILSSKIVENHDEKYHSAFLIRAISEFLSANNCRPEDIDLIVTNTGPGSFTGIRACTTVARVMAQQLHKKLQEFPRWKFLRKRLEKTLCCTGCKKEFRLPLL